MQVQDVPSVILQRYQVWIVFEQKWKIEHIDYARLVPHPPAAPDAAAIASICSRDNANPGVADFDARRGCLD